MNTVAMQRADEVVDLVALLLDHADPAAGPPHEIAVVAERVALGCLGDNHLWQDMHFASRAELSALMRRWFFTRKPDAGFVLTDFPATLLQAKVFDEWLEVRDENLAAVVPTPDSPEAVVDHYRTLGLLAKVVAP